MPRIYEIQDYNARMYALHNEDPPYMSVATFIAIEAICCGLALACNCARNTLTIREPNDRIGICLENLVIGSFAAAIVGFVFTVFRLDKVSFY